MAKKETFHSTANMGNSSVRKKHLATIVVILWLGCHNTMNAQWDITPQQYWEEPNSDNPAFAGSIAATRTTASYRQRWHGVENAPRQMVISADRPFLWGNSRHGAGILIATETTSNLRNSLLTAQYSFIKEYEPGQLQIGLQAGLYDLSYDPGTIRVREDSSRAEVKQVSFNRTDKKLPEISAGIGWSGKRFTAGISALRLNEPKFYVYGDSASATGLVNDSTRAQIPRSYIFFAQYNIPIFSPLEVQPMIWLQSESGKTYWKATFRMEYDKKFSGGITWSGDKNHTLFAALSLYGFRLGYAYSTDKFNKGTAGLTSHEVFIRYNFDLDGLRQKPQSGKSIRLL